MIGGYDKGNKVVLIGFPDEAGTWVRVINNIHYKVSSIANHHDEERNGTERKCHNVIHPLESCWTIPR